VEATPALFYANLCEDISLLWKGSRGGLRGQVPRDRYRLRMTKR
jgi:hypothetical protein